MTTFTHKPCLRRTHRWRNNIISNTSETLSKKNKSDKLFAFLIFFILFCGKSIPNSVADFSIFLPLQHKTSSFSSEIKCVNLCLTLYFKLLFIILHKKRKTLNIVQNDTYFNLPVSSFQFFFFCFMRFFTTW